MHSTEQYEIKIPNRDLIRNQIEAFQAAEKAAKTNDAEALNLLGWYYEKGIGTTVNYAKAIECYVAAAKQDYNAAKVNLAACYWHGRGVSVDPAAAIVWCAQINIETISKIEQKEPWFGMALFLKLINYFYSYFAINNLIKRLRENDPTLTSIDLSYMRIDFQKIQELTRFIPSTNKIAELNLSFTFPDEKLVNPLLAKLTRLKRINLKSTQLSEAEREKILEALNSIGSWLDKGNKFYKQSQFESAKECYLKAAAIDSENDEVQDCLAAVYFELKEYQSALAAINKAIEISPLVNYKYIKAKIMFELGDFQAALVGFEAYLKAHPDNIECLHRKALSLTRLSQFEKALNCYEQILTIDPNNKGSYKGKFNCYKKLGRLIDALACVEWLLKYLPDNEECQTQKYEILNMYFESNNINTFLLDYNKVSKQYLGSEPENKLLSLIVILNNLDQAYANDSQLEEKLEAKVNEFIKWHKDRRSSYKNTLKKDKNTDKKMEEPSYQNLMQAKQKKFLNHVSQIMIILNNQLHDFNKYGANSLKLISDSLLFASNLLLNLKVECIEYKENFDKAEEILSNCSRNREKADNNLSRLIDEGNQKGRDYDDCCYSNSTFEDQQRIVRAKELWKRSITDAEKACDKLYSVEPAEFTAKCNFIYLKSLSTWKQFLFESLTDIKNKLESLQAEIKMHCQYNVGENSTYGEQNDPLDLLLDEAFADFNAFEATLSAENKEAQESKSSAPPKATFFRPPPTDVIKQLMNLIKNNEEKAIHRILTTHENLSEIINTDIGSWDATCKGWTLLHLACKLGRMQAIDWLMSLNADINIVNNENQTALHIAVIYKQADIIEKLIDFGADTNIKDKNGQTAQQLAAQSDHGIEESIKELTSRNQKWQQSL